MAKNITLKKYYDHRRLDWYDVPGIDFESVKEQHRQNIAKLREIEEDRNRPNRPLYVVKIHSSGRHVTESCAHELSNSQLFLERSWELAKEEFKDREIVEDTIVLRELMMEPCNACYSTASALCNFSCSCFPGDDVTTKIYPHIMKADVMLFSTPVNQSMISSRLKILLDRLISLDGGYFVEELPVKDSKYREATIALSQKSVTYDPRMFGKVAAYFVTSKDANNPLEEAAPYPSEFKRLGYLDFVVGALSNQGTEYGWFHADPFYALSVATHDQELSYDKAEYDTKATDHVYGKEVILASLAMGASFIDKPPKLTSLGRVNRT